MLDINVHEKFEQKNKVFLIEMLSSLNCRLSRSQLSIVQCEYEPAAYMKDGRPLAFTKKIKSILINMGCNVKGCLKIIYLPESSQFEYGRFSQLAA